MAATAPSQQFLDYFATQTPEQVIYIDGLEYAASTVCARSRSPTRLDQAEKQFGS